MRLATITVLRVLTTNKARRNLMGYRSDVVMAFYADDNNNWAPMRLWLNANKPSGIPREVTYHDDTDKHRIIVQFRDVKWYDVYEDVNSIMDWYRTFIDEFEPIGGCAEYIRVGDDIADTETEYSGYNVQYCLNVVRDISID
jgi:hypothetical protein